MCRDGRRGRDENSSGFCSSLHGGYDSIQDEAFARSGTPGTKHILATDDGLDDSYLLGIEILVLLFQLIEGHQTFLSSLGMMIL